ncbi:YbaN family protein [Flavisphingomonas formosensis]|uniref:YbaN family protein n=1 Tax=Flavisphingomonas formosensis TaxID=861534 RepID=UPI0012F98DD9|nr:YbaN family protein [Sphingomonas formosensis]
MRGLPDGPEPSQPHRAVRIGWLLLGFVCVALGFIGALLPLMPTTIFLILAAGCFARSSPRLEAWLLDHPRFGPTLRAWRRDGAIPKQAKIAACAGIALGGTIFLAGARPRLWIAALVTLALAACAAWIVSRPLPPDQR